ncbi:MAG: hypothetical protein IPH32_07000 [Bacteroidetes bacterium]|jgi:hypothetical protein|nr:hypothetical protein [Bacteroidota bacterium]
MTNKIDLTHSVIVLRDDGIIELYANDHHVYIIEDVKENVKAFGELTGNEKVPVLIIGGSFSSLDDQTREFMATEESLKYSKAEAFLITSLAQKILINFYIKFNKPLVPTRVFTDKEEAIKWLMQYK